jgi:prepilin-type N-terminal cleavage/methylation domain-containing protein
MGLSMKTKGQEGLSLVEMMVTVAILGILIGVLSRFYLQSQSSMIDIENRTDLAAITQVVGVNMRTGLLQDYVVLGDMTENPAVNAAQAMTLYSNYYSYLSAGVAASPSNAPLAVTNTKAPVVIDDNEITGGATSFSSYIGNSLVMIAAVQPIVLTGITDNAAISSGGVWSATTATPLEDVRLGREQIVAYYLAADPVRKVSNVSGRPQPALKLVEWRSQPYVDYQDISGLFLTFSSSTGSYSEVGGVHLTNTVNALIALGYLYALDPSQDDASQAFHLLQNSATVPIVLTPTAVGTLKEQSWAFEDEFSDTEDPNPNPLKPRYHVVSSTHHGGIAGVPSTYSIAYNTLGANGASGSYTIHQILGGMQGVIQVPLICTPPNGGSLFPGGFETAIYGPGATQREAWARMVYIASSGARTSNMTDQQYTGNEAVVDVAFSNLKY